MNVKVITKFKDKYTKEWHYVNDAIKNISEERYNEIKKFVKKCDVEKTSKKNNKADSQE